MEQAIADGQLVAAFETCRIMSARVDAAAATACFDLKQADSRSVLISESDCNTIANSLSEPDHSCALLNLKLD
jgi:hypothetical protein